MWERGAVELTALGISAPRFVEDWGKRLKRKDAVAIGDVAILGCDWESPGTICTAFQACKSFERGSNGKQVTKALRREIPRLMQERGIYTASIYSLCIDPKAADWFRLLGFSEDLNYRGASHGGFVMRRFERKR